MIKRKPGRPRKVEQSVEGVVPEKRKPGRPRKTVTASMEKNMAPTKLNQYSINWRLGNGDPDRSDLIAHAFSIAANGDLLLTYGNETIAAFRDWQTIVNVDPPKVETVPMSQPENIPNTTGYQFQGNGVIPISATATFNEFNAGCAASAAPTIEIVEADRPE